MGCLSSKSAEDGPAQKIDPSLGIDPALFYRIECIQDQTVLDINGGQVSNPIITYENNGDAGSNNQVWKLIIQGPNLIIQSMMRGTSGLVIEQKANEDVIFLMSTADKPSQKWCPELVDSTKGQVALRNLETNKYLQNNGEVEDVTLVAVTNGQFSPVQTWKFTKCELADEEPEEPEEPEPVKEKPKQQMPLAVAAPKSNKSVAPKKGNAGGGGGKSQTGKGGNKNVKR